MQALPKTDVVIIGMGAAGGMASYVLTQAGLKVVGLEAGPRMDRSDFLAGYDEIDGWSIRNSMGNAKFNHELPTWRPSADAPTQAPPIPASPMMNGVGGSSVHYTSMSWRMREDDYKIRSSTIDRYGETAIPAGSTLVDWPVDYETMEPYYEKVEYLIGISGEGGVNPFESPRAKDYPMPPIMRTGYTELAAKATKALGYSPFAIPAAITSQEYNGRPACSYCGYCTGYGCWNDSKSSTLVTAIAAAEETGNLEVRPNSRVMRILSNDKGQVTGVEYLDEGGNLQTQEAGIVILSSYVYENNRLLLVSPTEYFKNGLVNNSGQVGLHYMVHAYPGATGLFDGQRLNRWLGTYAQGTALDDFNGDNFDHSGLGFIRGAITTIGSNESSPIGVSRTLAPGIPGWGSAYKQWIHENSLAVGNIGGQLEVLPYETNFLDLDPEVKDPLGMPVIRITFDYGANEYAAHDFLMPKYEEILKEMGASQTWSGPLFNIPINTHSYGGTRMGTDNSNSVVNEFGLAHEAANLAILGGSTFCSTSGYNPTETIEALAWRSAEHIASEFQNIAV